MKTLLIIDANALIHRAFHALPPLATPQNEPIGAIYGLTSMILKILKEEPDYVVAAFDRPEPTFRDEIFKEYKIHRPPAPNELVSQIIKARELFKIFGITTVEKAGFEADDLIGSLVAKFEKETEKNSLKITILTGDLDTLQLVQKDKIVVQTPRKGLSETMIYDEKAIEERFGLSPDQIPDYKGFVGDASDNIPGVNGVGPKTATKLLQEFQNIENLYKKMPLDHALAKRILPNKEKALFSKRLATIVKNVPLEIELSGLVYQGLPLKELTQYLTGLGFVSLVNRVLSPKDAPKTQPLFGQGRTLLPEDAVIFSESDIAERKTADLSSSKLKIAYDWKTIIKKLAKEGTGFREPLFDLEIAGWLIDPDQKDFTPEALARRFLFRSLDERNKEENLTALFVFFKNKLKEYNLNLIFDKIEMPLVEILAEMEETGIGVDKKALLEIKKDIDGELKTLTQKIYVLAGGAFNINSPRQVAQKIFEDLKIGTGRIKKTGGGQKSTAEDALNALKNNNPIIGLILEYRENFKIKTSFVEPLLALVQSDDHVHTNYIQTGTATGRLASEKPNLQNIPQESKWSKALRSSFVATEGWNLLSLDYSQLELRLLAHVSRDPKLVEAFLKNWDIHALTASQVFDVPLEKVTPEMRRLGKTLNFGVVYGMGSRGFSQTSGLALPEAQEFIAEYFHDFPAILTWQEKTKDEARALGYVTNLNGRRRWLLNIDSPNQRLRAEFERRAINMPIQSLGADILKMAMIQSVDFLKKNKFFGDQAKLLLSIHDELLFEVRDDILNKIVGPLKKIMESAYQIVVPLRAETKIGKNWGDMKSL